MLTGVRRNARAGAAGVDHGVGLREAFRVWSTIALHSFGGPAGQIAVMHRVLVDERRWISERRFLHALNYCVLLPGPEAQQLATYIGWLMHGTVGGVMAGVLFVLPGVVAILALSIAYVLWADVALVTGLLFGLQAAVVAIVAQAVVRVGRRALHTRLSIAIAAGAFAAIYFGNVPFPVIVAVAASLGFVVGRTRPQLLTRPVTADAEEGESDGALIGDEGEVVSARARRSAWLAAGVALALWAIPVVLVTVTGPEVLQDVATLFSKSAVITFGGAYAVLSYISQSAVSGYGWLRPDEMVTGLGMAETTPGPLIMVVQFVGFVAAYRAAGALSPMAGGLAGAALATWVTFVPCFFFIFAGAPFMERLRANRSLATALGAVTAAVVGVIANLAAWFALSTWFDVVHAYHPLGLQVLVPQLSTVNVAAVVISAAAIVAIFRYRVSVLRVLAGCTLAGIGVVLLGVQA